MTQDVILVTIDCWRPDALQHMPFISNSGCLTWDNITTTGDATKWAFSGILKGRFFSEVYDKTTNAATRGTNIASVLGNEGYNTGAFVASNPNVNDYLNDFDEVFNGGYYRNFEQSSVKKWYGRLDRFLKLEKDIIVEEILMRAKKWYESVSPPRFLWIHIMEPHAPYFPGLQRGWSVGLPKAYQAILKQYRWNGNLSDETLRILHRLHNKSLALVDDVLKTHFPWLTEPVFIISGDHGERFARGTAGHIGFSKEVITTPFGTNQEINTCVDSTQDIPRIICDLTGINIPSSMQPSLSAEIDGTPLIGGSVTGNEGLVDIGVYDSEGELNSTKVPNSIAKKNIKYPGDRQLEKVVASVVDNDILIDSTNSHHVPESRLKELGYL